MTANPMWSLTRFLSAVPKPHGYLIPEGDSEDRLFRQRHGDAPVDKSDGEAVGFGNNEGYSVESSACEEEVGTACAINRPARKNHRLSPHIKKGRVFKPDLSQIRHFDRPAKPIPLTCGILSWPQ